MSSLFTHEAARPFERERGLVRDARIGIDCTNAAPGHDRGESGLAVFIGEVHVHAGAGPEGRRGFDERAEPADVDE